MRIPHEPGWQKSTYSGGGDGAECVEVAHGAPHLVALRESDDPAVTVAARPAAVAGLIRHLKAAG